MSTRRYLTTQIDTDTDEADGSQAIDPITPSDVDEHHKMSWKLVSLTICQVEDRVRYAWTWELQ